MDSGYEADAVYDFCATNAEWAKPAKGSSTPMQSHFKLSTVNKDASKAYGMDLVMVDGGKYKDMIASRMHRKNDNGSWMVYKGCDEEYDEQVTAEHKILVKNGNSKPRLGWVSKHSHADNHFLDCEVYAMVAADTLGVRMLYLQNIQEQLEQKPEQYVPEEEWIKENEDWV